jgi:hypothetical protein
VHVPCSEEASIVDTTSAGVFWTFHCTLGLVITVAWNAWNATKTIGEDNTTGIKDMRVKEGDNIF